MLHSIPATERRFYTRVLPALALHTVLLMVTLPMVPQAGTLAARVLLALAPVLPLGYAIVASVRHISTLDELHRRAHLHAAMVGALVTCFSTLTWALLENAGLPHMRVVVVFPLFCGIYGAAFLVAMRRFQ